MQKVALARLQVEEQHWKTVGAIQARRSADEADVILMLNDFEASISSLGLAASLDRLATVDTRLEDTLDELITWATDAQTTLQEHQENLRKAAAKTREAEAELVKATRALGEAQKKGGKKAIALAEKHLRETQQQVESNKAEENGLRARIKTARNNIADGRRRLAQILDVLYVASALSAHGSTPGNLARLRLAQEEHRYSIRKSAVLAQAYEATISSGTQRLALYYKGGLKPEKIAQLIHSAATVAIPVAILTK
jgi:chromosome segregation ATPase